MRLLEITPLDAKHWLAGLPRDDEARKTEMRRHIAELAFLAGAEAQLKRLFPHIFLPSYPEKKDAHL